jgi:hypothetical protein
VEAIRRSFEELQISELWNERASPLIIIALPTLHWRAEVIIPAWQSRQEWKFEVPRDGAHDSRQRLVRRRNGYLNQSFGGGM